MKRVFTLVTALFLGLVVFSQTADTRQKFRIGFDANSIDHRQLLLTIDDRATDSVDWGFDGKMYEVFEDDIYWAIDNSNKYVIQATNTLAVDKEFPLGIITTGGEFTIKIDSLENPTEEFVIYLKDKELNQVYNLQDSAFTTTLSAGEYKTRFVLTFKDPSYQQEQNEEEIVEETELTTEPTTLEEIINMYFNSSDSSIKIINYKNKAIVAVNLFSINGRHFKRWKIHKNKDEINLPISVKNGVYIVSATTKKGRINKRILVQ
jgi:hypothetical protein